MAKKQSRPGPAGTGTGSTGSPRHGRGSTPSGSPGRPSLGSTPGTGTGSTSTKGASKRSLPVGGGSSSGQAAPAKSRSLPVGGGSGGGMPTAMVGEAAAAKVEGDSGKHTRRYAGRAVSGGIQGSAKGGLYGAAAGAATSVAAEAGKDTVGGVKKALGGGSRKKQQEKKLGAGGTSYTQDTPDQNDKDEGSSKGAGKKLGTLAAIGIAPQAMAMLGLLLFLQWLKSMFFHFVAALLHWLKALWILVKGAVLQGAAFLFGAQLAVGKAVLSGVNSMFGFGASGVMAAHLVGAGTVVTGMVGAVSMAASGGSDSFGQTSLREGEIADSSVCDVGGSSGSGAEVSAGEVTADAEESAKTVYGVLSSWGMPDENIAGILGNWSQESGIDPTSVEGIFTEPYEIGPRKKKIWNNDFTHIPGQQHGGIGLGQWSNDRTPMLLEYAEEKDVDWYTIETQLAFMADPKGDNPSDVEVFKDMIENSQGSPGEAALHYHHEWERSADEAKGLAEREADAKMWMGKISGWDGGDADLSQIEDVMGAMASSGASGIPAVFSQCEEAEEEEAGGGAAAASFSDRDGKTKPGKWGGHENGKIPEKELQPLTFAEGESLRKDAATNLEKLNKAYKKKFGQDLILSDSYRSYDEQVELKGKRGKWAATPGTSNHGWAMAIDIREEVGRFGTTEHEWMQDNAPKYGWKHPDWAGPNGSLPEPWHWEYWGKEKGAQKGDDA